MEEIKWGELSNAEIIREQMNLKNSYEKLKSEILEQVDKLDKMNDEYLKSEKELQKRNYRG